MDAKRMADLFNIDLEASLDGTDGHSDDHSGADFSQKATDIQSVLSPEPVTDTVLIKEAVNKTNKKVKETKKEPLNESVEDIVKIEETIPGDIVEDINKGSASLSIDADNPLELSGIDLKAYQQIKEHYQQFTLYDGSFAYRDFYKSKVNALRHLLGQFKILDTQEMRAELATVQTNHFIGDDDCTPEVIREKLDSAYAQRVRLSSLLTSALEQFPAWSRFLDMIRSKLWKDHDVVRGSHRRDGMAMEHLSDMESYVSCLQGFIDAAKQYDSMLKAASESLSRQLTCIQLNEYGMGHRIEQNNEHTNRFKDASRENSNKNTHSEELDVLDSIDNGVVIRPPVISSNSAVTTISYSEEDELSKVG